MKHKVAQFYVKEIKEALKMFGEYTYYDKGPEEVMQIDAKPLFALSQSERIQVFKELMAYKHGGNFLNSLTREFYDSRAEKCPLSEEQINELVEIVEAQYK